MVRVVVRYCHSQCTIDHRELLLRLRRVQIAIDLGQVMVLGPGID